MQELTVEQQLRNFVWYLLEHDYAVCELQTQGESKFDIVAAVAWRARVVFGQNAFDNGELNLLIERAFDYWVSEA
jgi:hypothetical protein